MDPLLVRCPTCDAPVDVPCDEAPAHLDRQDEADLLAPTIEDVERAEELPIAA